MKRGQISAEYLIVLIATLLIALTAAQYIISFTHKEVKPSEQVQEYTIQRYRTLLVTDNLDTAYLLTTQYPSLYVTVMSSSKFLNNVHTVQDYDVVYVLEVNPHDKQKFSKSVRDLIEQGFKVIVDSSALTTDDYRDLFGGTYGSKDTLSGTYRVYSERGCGYICTYLPKSITLRSLSVVRSTCIDPLYRVGTYVMSCRYMNSYYISYDASSMLDESSTVKKLLILYLG